MLSHVRLVATPWTVAHQAPLSMGFPRQEDWSGLPFPTPGDLLDVGIELTCLASPALVGRFFTTAPPGKLPICEYTMGLHLFQAVSSLSVVEVDVNFDVNLFLRFV